MEIAISGCGVTGTATAFFLAKAGHDVTIFEQAAECKPIGAGIMLQPSGQIVVEKNGDCSNRWQNVRNGLGGMVAQLTTGQDIG